MGKDTAVLDLGSGKIIYALCELSSEDVLLVKDFCAHAYGGFYNATFNCPAQLSDEIGEVVADGGGTRKQRRVYVSVPADFIKLHIGACAVSYGKERLVTQEMLAELRARGNIFAGDADYRVIDCSDIGYRCDGRDYFTVPIGKHVAEIEARISYVAASQAFCSRLEEILSPHFSQVVFISPTLTQGRELLPPEVTARGAAVLDFGFTSSSMAYFQGGGLAQLSSKPTGSGFMFDDISQRTGLPFDAAFSLAEKLNLLSDDGEDYEAEDDSGIYHVPLKDVNAAARDAIDGFASMTNDFFAEIDCDNISEVYLTGGAITGIRGGVSAFSQACGKRVRVIETKTPQYSMPMLTSFTSVAYRACRTERGGGLWQRILAALA